MSPSPRPFGRFFARILSGLVVVAVLFVGLFVAYRALGNPFTTKQVDRTAPPVLTKLTDLSSFHAASGQFEVLVDIEHDVKWLPGFIAGDRTFFVGIGNVDATVDFAHLSDTDITVSKDAKSVVVQLPAAVLQPAIVDPAQSHVASRSRGVLNRVAGAFEDNPTSEAPLYEAAKAKITEAAAATDLLARAQTNTRATLTSMLQALGYENVSVVFGGGPAAS
jgi:Protein of unknown function (DUF4230)